MAILESKEERNIRLFLNTRRHLLLSIALIWGTVCISFFAIKPQFESIFEQRNQLKKDTTQLASMTRKLNELEQVRVSEQFKYKEKVDEVLPSKKPILELLAGLHQISQQSKISVTALKINPGEINDEATAEVITKKTTPVAQEKPTTKSAGQSQTNETKSKGYNYLKMELKIKGSREGVDQFLTSIEQIAPFTSVVELTLREPKNVKDPSDQLLSEAEIALQTYYYTQTISVNVDNPLPAIGDAELRAFTTIQRFLPPNYQKPTDISSADIEDLFGISGFEFN